MSRYRVDILPLPLLALLSLSSLAEATCYVAAYGLVGKETGWTACPGTATSPGGVETCCIPGSECGEDSLCRVPASSNPGNNSWYQAGCTDSSYSASVCQNWCVDYTQTYVYYENSQQQWMCCGDGGCNGTNTDATFNAVSPDDWKQITGGSAASSAASSSKPTSTANGNGNGNTASSSGVASQSGAAKSSASTKDSRPSSGDFKPIPAGAKGKAPLASTSDTNSGSGSRSKGNSSGLSSGTEAGIGIAIALAALALIAAVVAIVLFRRKRERQDTAAANKDAFPGWTAQPAIEKDVYPDRRRPVEKHVYGNVHEVWSPHAYSPAHPYSPATEMSTESVRMELPTNQPVHELSGGNYWENRF